MSEATNPLIPKQLPGESIELFGHRMTIYLEQEADQVVERHRTRLLNGNQRDLKFASDLFGLINFANRFPDTPLVDEVADTPAPDAYASFRAFVKEKEAQLLAGDPEVVETVINDLAISILINELPADPML